jgi:hypothetical protein
MKLFPSVLAFVLLVAVVTSSGTLNSSPRTACANPRLGPYGQSMCCCNTFGGGVCCKEQIGVCNPILVPGCRCQ